MFIESCDDVSQIISKCPLTESNDLCYTTRRQFDGFAFIALLAQVKPQNSTERAAIRWVRSYGRISFRDFFQGFCGPHLESDWRLRPLFLLVLNMSLRGNGG